MKLSSRELAEVILPILHRYKDQLDRQRCIAKVNGKRPDWLWNELVSAFATNGRSSYYDVIIKPDHERYIWSALVQLSPAERRNRLAEAVNPRRAKRKNGESRYSGYLDEAFRPFKKAGGPEQIRREYEAGKFSEDRIRYLMQFKGIGKKYARDIPRVDTIMSYLTIWH